MTLRRDHRFVVIKGAPGIAAAVAAALSPEARRKAELQERREVAYLRLATVVSVRPYLEQLLDEATRRSELMNLLGRDRHPVEVEIDGIDSVFNDVTKGAL